MIRNSLHLHKFCIIREENVELQKFFLIVVIQDTKHTTKLIEYSNEVLEDVFANQINNDIEKIKAQFSLVNEQEECLCENFCEINLKEITQGQQQTIELKKSEQKIAAIKFEYFIEQNQEQTQEQEQETEQQQIDQQIDQEFYQDEDQVDNQEQEVVEHQEENLDQTENQNGISGQQGQKKKTKTKKQKKTTKIKNKQKEDFVLHGLTNEKMREYDGLKDENLQSFFYSRDKKKHLQKMGLITRKGYIIEKPDEYLRRKEFYKKVKQEQKLFKQQQKKLQTKVKDPYKENLPTDLEKQYLTGKKVQKKKDKQIKPNTNLA